MLNFLLLRLLGVGLLMLFCVPRVTAFQILIDVNQMNGSEAGQDAVLAADGVWAITHNSSGIATSSWPAALSRLNAVKWTVSEDDPFSSYEVNSVTGYISRPVDAAMCYQENNPAANDTILTTSQIDAAVPTHGTNIIVLSRSYQDPRGAYVRSALADANCSGIVFETNPAPAGGTMWNQNFNAGINYCLNLGKKCYLLLPPRNGLGANANYLSDIQSAMAYFVQSKQMNSPNLYIVLAVYGRATTGAGYLTPDAGTSSNTILAAVNYLKSYRLSILPPHLPGHLYQIINKANGFALDDFRGGLRSGTLVVQNPIISGRDTQQWSFALDSNGYYTVKNQHNGLLLEDQKSSLAAGARIDLGVPDGTAQQQWTISDLGNGYFSLVNRYSGLTLENYQSKMSPGALVVQDAANVGSAQQWQMTVLN